jgi:hypothetical protein
MMTPARDQIVPRPVGPPLGQADRERGRAFGRRRVTGEDELNSPGAGAGRSLVKDGSRVVGELVRRRTEVGGSFPG